MQQETKGAAKNTKIMNRFELTSRLVKRLDELEFIVDRSIKQAVATQAPAAFILSPLLTGGKVFKA